MCHETLASLSALPPAGIDALRAVLAGQQRATRLGALRVGLVGVSRPRSKPYPDRALQATGAT